MSSVSFLPPTYLGSRERGASLLQGVGRYLSHRSYKGTGPKILRPTVKNGHLPGSIHRRNPTTTSRGNFCLLRFRPGPVRSSLDDLVRRSSLRPTISTRCIARTPVRHTATGDRTPNNMPSNSLDFQSSWITRPRHRSQSIRFFLLRYLTILT
ncbi:uncharacterized protein TNCV_4903371 [Trichonephila clavipes]|uniref:Uncharacterized protein n=1 Tax=Trichonephila clavipes TaxID=2585209 RepID=A0A8X6S9D8_TRICX|nr:uncharacterized protein TNCV_4903371 [Trichonephila clavipes]